MGADARVAGQGHELGEDGGDGAGGGGADAQGADAGGDAAAGEASAAVGTRHAQADDGAAGAVLGDEDGGEALALGQLGGQGAAPVAPARVEAGGQGGGGDLGDVVAAGGEDGGGEQADVPGGGGGLGGEVLPVGLFEDLNWNAGYISNSTRVLVPDHLTKSRNSCSTSLRVRHQWNLFTNFPRTPLCATPTDR